MYLSNLLKDKFVLLIDDDEWIRNSLKVLFENEGCRLSTVQTAEEGLDELNQQTYDIILVDYRLPGMDGIEFLHRIRLSHPDILKILITAYGSDELYSKAKAVGVREFVDKPLTFECLIEAFRNVCDEPNFASRA
jgi:DNA-binding NtrC family response regulator